MKLYHNLFCRDIEAQLRFYSHLLGVGEALVSFLDDKGRPAIVERGLQYRAAYQLSDLGLA